MRKKRKKKLSPKLQKLIVQRHHIERLFAMKQKITNTIRSRIYYFDIGLGQLFIDSSLKEADKEWLIKHIKSERRVLMDLEDFVYKIQGKLADVLPYTICDDEFQMVVNMQILSTQLYKRVLQWILYFNTIEDMLNQERFDLNQIRRIDRPPIQYRLVIDYIEDNGSIEDQVAHCHFEDINTGKKVIRDC